MSTEVAAMVGACGAALIAGFVLIGPRLRAASGAGKVVALGPVFEAAALATFAAEHFTAARDLMPIVPRWLPGPLFWTYFAGAALLAAAVSFIAWRCVGWSAPLLALFFLLIVALLDLPRIPRLAHERLFWTLTVRETTFAAGALVLAGSVWRNAAVARLGRSIVAAAIVFYAIEHFLFPRNVPGVPLEKMTPAWMPAPVAIAYVVGIVLLVAGPLLLIPRTRQLAAAGAGTVLVLLTALFYVPIFAREIHTSLAVEGMNYVGDTLLFAATVLLAGFGAEPMGAQEAVPAMAASGQGALRG